MFFSGVHLPENRNFRTGCLRRFLVHRFRTGFTPIFAQFLFGVRRFLSRFSADVSSPFWRLKKIRDSEMTIKIILRGRVKKGDPQGVRKGVSKGPTLEFYCRPKAQEKQHFWKVGILLSSLFPRNYSDNNFGQLPPSHPPRGRIRRELLSFRRLLN